MPEKKFTVTVDIAAPIATRIEDAAAEYEGKYILDECVYKRFLSVYRKFRKFALQNDGGIENTDVYGVDKVKIASKVPAVDLFREGLDLFSELLTMVDSIDISTSDSGDLVIEVGVAGFWKAV